MKSVIFLMFFNQLVFCYNDWSSDRDPQKWNNQAKETLENLLNGKINKNIAKNIILFLGDGMGIGTITAGRIRKGQKKGFNGEETVTFMESLDQVALSKVILIQIKFNKISFNTLKTYSIDAQTTDSAGKRCFSIKFKKFY